ncbi:hypothetical protein [Bacillus wiedmannii]|uniref:hypothetical protein n=1 Tax=Bacillus wiedmannii TaxID=1890302 RepID=UPI000B74EFC7|nr:hypothetical protein BK740_18645 [Bacillus thuringiensis serovar argentinensis]
MEKFQEIKKLYYMSNIYQEMWDADIRENGIKAVFDKRNADIEKGYILVEAKKISDEDERGHGTRESVNVLSLEPDIDFTMVKMSKFNMPSAF